MTTAVTCGLCVDRLSRLPLVVYRLRAARPAASRGIRACSYSRRAKNGPTSLRSRWRARLFAARPYRLSRAVFGVDEEVSCVVVFRALHALLLASLRVLLPQLCVSVVRRVD